MKNSHLIVIINTFSKKEVRELRKWLASPAHNQREDVVSLFEYLTSNNRIFNEKQLKKERIFSKIFPQEPFDDAKIRQTTHFLLKAIEEFLIYQELREDQVRAKMALASVYRKRKLDKAFQKTMRNVEEYQEKAPFRNEHFLRNEYLFQQEKYTYLENQRRNIPMNLQEVSDALDTTYCADKLRQSCLMLAHQRVFKADYNVGLLDRVLEYVEKENFLDVPAIVIYYYGYQAFTNLSKEEYFHKLREVVDQYGHLFPKAEIRDIYLMSINYCIGKINAGNRSFIRESFEIYRQGFGQKILIENNHISRWTFLNVIRIAFSLKELDWVADFVDTNQQYLDEKHQESIVLYSQAHLNFEKRDYDKAMSLLVHVDFDDVLLNLYAKVLLIQMYYALEELDALESLLESMRTYIHRKQLMGSHDLIYRNIIRYTRKLIRINPYDAKQKEKLREEIQGAKGLQIKGWLLEQLEAA